MTAIHVDVTAEDLVACAVVPDIGEGFKSSHPDGFDPVELAIARATGQDADCDGGDVLDGPELATIGARGDANRNTLVVSLPIEEVGWVARYYRGEPVEPFSFDIEIEDWLVALIARNTTIDDEVLAMNAEDRRVAALDRLEHGRRMDDAIEQGEV